MALFGFAFLISLAIWVGSIVFFSFIAAPHVSGSCPPQQAVRILARMSRAYLHLGWICGTVALVSSLFMPAVEGIFITTRIVLVAVMFLLSLYLAFGAGSKVREVREAVEAAGEEEIPRDALASFDEFHGITSQLNGALLLLGLLVVFITAFYA